MIVGARLTTNHVGICKVVVNDYSACDSHSLALQSALQFAIWSAPQFALQFAMQLSLCCLYVVSVLSLDVCASVPECLRLCLRPCVFVCGFCSLPAVRDSCPSWHMLTSVHSVVCVVWWALTTRSV